MDTGGGVWRVGTGDETVGWTVFHGSGIGRNALSWPVTGITSSAVVRRGYSKAFALYVSALVDTASRECSALSHVTLGCPHVASSMAISTWKSAATAARSKIRPHLSCDVAVVRRLFSPVALFVHVSSTSLRALQSPTPRTICDRAATR